MIWKKNRSKYGNVQLTFHGEKFDSIAEQQYYMLLRQMEKNGEITDLHRQTGFCLIPAQKDENGKVIERACYYYADFTYKQGEKLHVIDVKGVRTDVYKIKRKLMLERFGIRVEEVEA